MDKAVLDLIQFYQRELRESPEARQALKRLNINAQTVEHYQLAYCSGRAINAMSREQKKLLRNLDLIGTKGEHFRNCVIIPVYNESGGLVDLFGLSAGRQHVKPVYWRNPPRGIFGGNIPASFPEIILTDSPLYALHAFQLGHQNLMAIRSMDELPGLISLLGKHDVRRVYLLSRTRCKQLMKAFEKVEVEAVKLPCPVRGVGKTSLAIVGTLPLKKETDGINLTEKSESRLSFKAKGVSYRVESLSLAGIGMRVQVKAEANGMPHLDKLDLASAQSRRKYSRLCGLRLGVSVNVIEDHLAGIADIIDNLLLEEADKQTRTARKLTKKDESTALDLLRTGNVMEAQAQALQDHCGIIGEDQNRKLAVLIAASRLLDKPLGCIIRGAPGSGKSALIQAVSRLLPVNQVLYLSRLTPQALYFLPKEALLNSVMVIDEYEGISDSEYSLRTMMSSQVLSLAITMRDGGKLPVTRTVEIPARLSVFVSATRQINIENLSRFIELKMDSSEEQTLRVMQALANPATNPAGTKYSLPDIQNCNQLLKPCKVEIPFGDNLLYRSRSVLARRQFAQLIGLISAHAALHQFQRDIDLAGNLIMIKATKDDYKAVHGLLASITNSPEEALSPAASELLKALQVRKENRITIKQGMEALGWSYSKCYRTLGELQQLHLVEPDTYTNGTRRMYTVAPYSVLDKGLQGLPAPGAM